MKIVLDNHTISISRLTNNHIIAFRDVRDKFVQVLIAHENKYRWHGLYASGGFFSEHPTIRAAVGFIIEGGQDVQAFDSPRDFGRWLSETE